MSSEQKNEGLWWALLSLTLGLEAAGLAWLVIVNVGQVFEVLGSGQTEFLAGQIGVTLILLLGAVWVFFTAKGAVQKRSWVRASNLTIQVLVLAAATGILQGILGEKPVGVALLILALLGLFGSIMLVAKKPKEDAS